jgi:hypothetical protein
MQIFLDYPAAKHIIKYIFDLRQEAEKKEEVDGEDSMRNKPFHILLCAVIALILLAASITYAEDSPLIITLGTGYIFNPSQTETLGNLFTVADNSITITALGLLDDGTAGLNQNHSVGLWTTSGSLLARVDFSPGLDGFENNGFIYQNLASQVVLLPGVSYVLGASYQDNSTDGVYINSSSQYETWSPAVSFNGAGRYTAQGAGFTFPSYQVNGMSYIGPNALFTIPEPATLLLFGFGAVMLTWRGK